MAKYSRPIYKSRVCGGIGHVSPTISHLGVIVIHCYDQLTHMPNLKLLCYPVTATWGRGI